jgi:hypothetical protein
MLRCETGGRGRPRAATAGKATPAFRATGAPAGGEVDARARRVPGGRDRVHGGGRRWQNGAVRVDEPRRPALRGGTIDPVPRSRPESAP